MSESPTGLTLDQSIKAVAEKLADVRARLALARMDYVALLEEEGELAEELDVLHEGVLGE